SSVVRREVFSHVGRFDPQWDLAIDYDFWLRAARHYAFDYVDEDLVLYRTGHGNLSKKLADRVAIAMSIMDRAVNRFGMDGELSREVIAEGFASTCRTLGYVMRPSEPRTSARWYLKALRWPNERAAGCKGLVAAAFVAFRGKREPCVAENAAANQ